MSYLQIFDILSKPWANVNDIKIVGSCGRDKATRIRDNISNDILKNGKSIPCSKTKVVPMKSVIDYFNLDVDYVFSMAEKEKLLMK